MKNKNDNISENKNNKEEIRNCDAIKTNLIYYIPLFFLLSYIVLSYTIFVNFIIIPSKQYDSLSNITLNAILFFGLICLIISLIKDPGIVKENENLDYIKKLKYAYCYTCMIYKEEKVHHCKKCNVCIKHLDHHCYWLNKCIGLNNRKQFVLFLFYSLISKLIILMKSFNRFIGLLWKSKIYTHYLLLVFFLLFVLVLLYLIYFFIFNIKLILTGTTAIESYNRNMLLRTDDQSNPKSYYENFCLVFGKNCLLWFLPITFQNNKEKNNKSNDFSKSRNKVDIINEKNNSEAKENFSTNFSELNMK